MSKRLGVLSAAIAAAALVVGVVSPAAGASGNDHQHQTIRVDAIATELNLVNVSTKGPSLGDEIVFSEKLLQAGKRLGTRARYARPYPWSATRRSASRRTRSTTDRSPHRRWLSLVARHRTLWPSLEAPASTRVRMVRYTSNQSQIRRGY